MSRYTGAFLENAKKAADKCGNSLHVGNSVSLDRVNCGPHVGENRVVASLMVARYRSLTVSFDLRCVSLLLQNCADAEGLHRQGATAERSALHFREWFRDFF